MCCVLPTSIPNTMPEKCPIYLLYLQMKNSHRKSLKDSWTLSSTTYVNFRHFIHIFEKSHSVSSLILGHYSNVEVNFIGVKEISECCSAEHQPEIVDQISTILK